jgi:hypothetical protein
LKPLNTNSLRNALTTHAESSHPEAELLNGFAEGSLLAEERRRVVQHLACCDECRVVVALASDAAPALVPEMTPTRGRRSIFSIGIPAFSAAAAVAVTFIVLHHRPRPVQHEAQHEAALTVQSPEAPASQSTIANVAPAASARSAPKAHEPAAPGMRAASPTSIEAPASPQIPESAGLAAGVTAARAELAPAPAQTPDASNEISADRTSSSATASPKTYSAHADQAANTPSSAFANAVTTQALAKAAATPIARPHWRINRQGQPERSYGRGPWQAVLPTDAATMRVLATAVTDVWIGGENAQLYHSSDNGQTWSRIALPEKNGPVHSLAHIQIDSPADITIRASDATTWTTSNGGASWK